MATATPLSKMKLAELKKLCSDKGIAYDATTKITKAQLIALILESDRRNNDDDDDDNDDSG
jgi:hypothetical protein